MQQEHEEAANDLEGYLNNPINAYRLIKRLYTDWPAYEETVTVDVTRTSESQKKNQGFLVWRCGAVSKAKEEKKLLKLIYFLCFIFLN